MCGFDSLRRYHSSFNKHKKLRVKTRKGSSVTITRKAITSEAPGLHRQSQQAYSLPIKRPVPHCVYWTSAEGVSRTARSAAYVARKVIKKHGIRQLECYTVTCSACSGLKGWRKLERALMVRAGQIRYENRERFLSPARLPVPPRRRRRTCTSVWELRQCCAAWRDPEETAATSTRCGWCWITVEALPHVVVDGRMVNA